MTNITVINDAADSTMCPEERDLFDTFSDDTKQRFLNQILKRASVPDLIGALRPFAEEHPMGNNYVKFHTRLTVAARAALAKATGTA